MDPKEVGPWKKIKILGSGGFGQVTLWYNPTTSQRIAIKKLHDQSPSDVSAKEKQTERWCKEVEIMKKLNHGNIVSVLEVPREFRSLTKLPLLAMEYCSQGDLRGVLNKPENCNGLREPEVLDILKDVSSGLAYLHSCKIIHRDLKPDNIVLMEKDSSIIYKLIDLGYAKTLDQSSLSQSFVGTIQYIAPELFLGKAYTSSVDYWSFGLLAHEIITGYRPFLPGFNPSDWMRQIQNKERNIICVLENANGDITYSTTISRRNHVSRCLLRHIEKWLQLALDWDGQTRGREPDRNRPVIFEELANILCKKIVKVFSVPTYETLSYEITPETDIYDLRRWLGDDSDLELDNQHLLLSNGKSLNMRGNLLNALKTEKLDKNSISIFLYNSGSISIRNTVRNVPKYVEDLLDDADRSLRYRHLKRRCADSVYFLQSEATNYRNLLQGIAVKILSTKQKTLAIESLYEDVGEEWSQIESYSQFLSLSQKIDLENYIHYRKTGKLKASAMVQKWIQNVTEVDKKINELKNSFNKNEQKQLVFVARQRCRNLDNHPGNEMAKKTVLDDIVGEGQKVWETIQRLSKEGRESPPTNSAVASLMRKSIEETNKLLNSQIIQSLFVKISEADDNLSKFLTHLTTLLKSTRILKLVIENTQRERQQNVWNLIANVKENENENEKRGEKKSESVEKELKNCPPRSGSCTNGMSDIPDKSNRNSVLLSNLIDDTKFPNKLDALTIINDNNHLRYRIQEVQQICNDTVKQMQSLKLDFGTE
ncbi:hypothetical protein RUM44_013713 [Polyplax serrata]|uniref:IkappaB kinase n=1 Tax=Polyplax serrata TaxID=468196 RepID=A0ABR1BJ64_POLSC